VKERSMTEDELRRKLQEENRNNLDAAQAVMTGIGLVLPFWLVVLAIVLAYFFK
jgi:SOS response regulatory protein OraA/RecX